MPKNSGLLRSGSFPSGKEPSVKMLLNHVILGHVVDPSQPPRDRLTTLAGTPLIFTTDPQGPMVNGIRLTGEEHKLSDGVVHIIESTLPVLEASEKVSPPAEETVAEGSTRLPPLTHRFATFKPRRGGRPSYNNALHRTKPETPVEVTLEVDPVFGDDIGGVEPGVETEFEDKPSSSSSPAPSPSSGFSEFAGSSPRTITDDDSFLSSFLQFLESNSDYTGAEFLHHFLDANITQRFRETGRYTALVPYDSAFYSYYPIDWGFNPFLVRNFTRDVMMNHFVRGNIALENLPSLAELTTLGGRVIKFIWKGGKLFGNGVEVVLESETQLSRGRSYSVNELLFVDYDRVFELQAEHGDLETPPLLGDPWPTSQFLSHLLGRLMENQQTSFFAEYLNLTNLAYLLPGHDENLDPLKYTAFIPVDIAIMQSLYADAPDPFLLDEVLRDRLVLNHLVPGRFYEKDLEDGMSFQNLANNTLTITKQSGGNILVNGAKIVKPQTFIYNLGVLYLIDGMIGISDQDIITSIDKYPDLHLEGPADETTTGTANPSDEARTTSVHSTTTSPRTASVGTTTTSPRTTSVSTTTTASRAASVYTSTKTPRTTAVHSTTTAPRTASVRTSTTAQLTTTSRPVVTRKSTITPTPTSISTPTTTRFFNVPRRPDSPRQTTTSSTPQPTPTTPRIRFETRTEISISRQINDGAVEAIENHSS